MVGITSHLLGVQTSKNLGQGSLKQLIFSGALPSCGTLLYLHFSIGSIASGGTLVWCAALLHVYTFQHWFQTLLKDSWSIHLIWSGIIRGLSRISFNLADVLNNFMFKNARSRNLTIHFQWDRTSHGKMHFHNCE